MSSSRDLLTLFIALELVSAPGFMLAGWCKGDVRSNEAALKFFIYTMAGSVLMLVAILWLYFLNHYQGFLVRVRAATGEEPKRPMRLGMSEIYASPVAADGNGNFRNRVGTS